ncbi:MAG: tyrosine-type recombinase/integrase [Steroidobacteraceae bacterium]
MNALAPYLEIFLREYLPRDRRLSVHTIDTYAYAFQLLVCFAAERLRIAPSSLQIEQLDAPLILSFLDHIEIQRHNLPQTRNGRLGAVKAFFRFLEYRLPAILDQVCRIKAIPIKRTDQKLVNYLTHEEMQALLDAPDPRTRSGTRDRAMLHLAFAAGLRVSELVGLRRDELTLHPQPLVHVRGKGRRERELPLWKETAAVLRAWLAVRSESPAPELFLNANGDPMTRSGFEYILDKHVELAAQKQPSLATKRISPHVLRHTCAMHTLLATRDVRKVSLWLGHASLQSTEIYLRADPTEKLEALAAVMPPTLRRGRFKAPDKLLAMLRSAKPGPHYA